MPNSNRWQIYMYISFSQGYVQIDGKIICISFFYTDTNRWQFKRSVNFRSSWCFFASFMLERLPFQVNTPRNEEQQKALQSVQGYIDGLIDQMQKDLNKSKDVRILLSSSCFGSIFSIREQIMNKYLTKISQQIIMPTFFYSTIICTIQWA